MRPEEALERVTGEWQSGLFQRMKLSLEAPWG